MSTVAWQDRMSKDGFANKYQTNEKYNTIPEVVVERMVVLGLESQYR